MLVVFTYDFPHKKSHDGLLKLIYSGFRPDLVIGAPFRELRHNSAPILGVSPRGLNFPHPAEICDYFGITYEAIPHDSNQLFTRLHELQPNLGVILGARILKESIITVFQKGIINVHPGCLPHNRGLDNLKWAIIDQLPQAVSTHLINSKIDLGELIEISMVPVYEDDSFIEIFIRIQNYELESLISTVRKLESNAIESYTLSTGKYNKTMDHDSERVVLDKFDEYKRNYELITKKHTLNHPSLPWVTFES